MPSVLSQHLSVDGKLTSGEPGIGLDSPDVSGNRRTATSAISLNYDAPRVTRGVATFGGAAPAVGRPLLAGKREETRHEASAPTSAISLNYDASSRGPEPGRLGPTGPSTFGRATPATKRPLLAEERGDARYAASSPKSANSGNYGTGKVTRGLATFHEAAPAEERSLFAGKREETIQIPWVHLA